MNKRYYDISGKAIKVRGLLEHWYNRLVLKNEDKDIYSTIIINSLINKEEIYINYSIYINRNNFGRSNYLYFKIHSRIKYGLMIYEERIINFPYCMILSEVL
jgi:hypothetical protein